MFEIMLELVVAALIESAVLLSYTMYVDHIQISCPWFV